MTGATGTMTTMTYRQVLTTPNVPQLLLSASLSRLASEMLLFSVVLYVLAEFHSPVLAGASGFFLTLPGFLISPVAGAVVDRMGATTAVVLDTLSSGVFISLIVVASATGLLGPGLLLVLLALYSLTSPLSAGGIRTLFPRFVPTEAYDKTNALDLSTYSVIEVAGPLVAGGLIALIGPDPTLVVVAVMFGAATASLLLLRGSARPAPAAADQPRRHLLAEAWQGLRYLFGNGTLRGLALSYSCYQVTYGVLVVTVPVAVAQLIVGHGPTTQYAGLLWSGVGLCSAGGALVAGKYLRAGRERGLLVGATLLLAVVLAPVALIGALAVLAAGLGLLGVLDGALACSVLSLRQRRTEPGWLGRVMTVSISVNLAGFPIGTALGGLLAAHTVSGAFAVAAVFALVASVAGALCIPAERTAPA
jgi:MFS family permease